MKSLIIADVHANLPALEAVFAHEQTWDEVLFLGDAVMSGPFPNEVVELLARQPGIFIRGNHDRELFDIDLSIHPDNPHHQWDHWTRRVITADNLRILQNDYIDTCAITRGSMSIRLVHGNFAYSSGSRLWPDSPAEDFTALAQQFPETYLFSAHSHVQFIRYSDHRVFVNPGTVGQARLGRPLACYAVLTNDTIERKAVPYDVERTCEAMETLPLDPSFIHEWQTCFRTGLLPVRYNMRDFAPLLARSDIV